MDGEDGNNNNLRGPVLMKTKPQPAEFLKDDVMGNLDCYFEVISNY